MPKNTPARRPFATPTAGSVPVSRALELFRLSLVKPGNYPRLVRPYLLFCVAEQHPVHQLSVDLYGADKPGNRVSPVRKFLKFAQAEGITHVAADPPELPPLPPAPNALVLQFLHEAAHLRGDRSRQTYARALEAFFRWLEAQQPAAAFNALAVANFVNALRQQGKSPFTVNLYLSAVKQLARWVVQSRERLDSSPFDIRLTPEQVEGLRDVQLVKGLSVERRFYKDGLDDADRDRLLRSIDDPADRAAIALMALCGLRTVEVTRLRVADVEFDAQKLWVLGKGRHTRKAVKLFEATAEAVRLYLRDLPTELHPKDALFPGLTTGMIRYRVNKYLRALDLKTDRISAHSLRHTAGQSLIRQGVEPVHVQRQLRHEQFETTQFYIRQQTEQDYFDQMPDDV